MGRVNLVESGNVLSSVKVFARTVLLSAGLLSFSTWGNSRIQQLTSKKEASKAEKELERQSTASPAERGLEASQIPGGLHRHALGVGVGQTFILGDFKDNGKNQITADLLYSYSASYSFDLLTNLHYSKHKFNKRYVQLSGLSIGVKGRFFHFDSFSPFVLAGLGFYSPKMKREVEGRLTVTDSQIVFGPHGGGGVDLRLNDNLAMGMLAQYHNPFDVKQELGPQVEGSYFKLLLTVFYIF